MKEASKIFVIQKEPEKKLIGRKRKSEHNEGDLDEQNKDKFCWLIFINEDIAGL